MINVRQFIKGQLETLCKNVNIQRLETVTTPLITYAQVSDIPVSRMYNDMEYQIDIYESTFAKALSLAGDVDALFEKLGWSKSYQSPDNSAYIGTDLYHIVLSYKATVNRKWNAVISSQNTQ